MTDTFELEGVNPSESDDQLLILEELNGFIGFGTQLVQSCRQRLVIYSVNLDPQLYGDPAFVEACSAFVRANPRNTLQILLQFPQRVITYSHPLVRLQQRLTDKIKIRTLPADFDPEDIHKLERQFMVGDDDKLMLQHESSSFRGFVGFCEKPKALEFAQKFDYLWHHGVAITALQRLGI